MSVTSFVLLSIAGLAAGLLSSVAGLASLVSYPALLAFGLPPVTANVTNTAGLFWSGIGSTISSLRELRGRARQLIEIGSLTIVGGIAGALLLVRLPADSFTKIVPFFILASGLLLLVDEHRRAQAPTSARPHAHARLWANLGALGVGIYTGYFGAAGGMVMLAILSATMTAPLPVVNAVKNVACFGANTISLVVYMVQTRIAWLMVIPLGLGLFIGGYIGPIIVRHVPMRPLRILIALAAFGLAAQLFWQAYR